ncbi:MAG: aldehyde dehydrogenase family protein [Rhodobacteraceae bacterium]|nr:aldehyde dehydrogenase family protein [Paracoccaceae bacterium]
MINKGKFYINGAWVNPEATEVHKLINPADESAITNIPMAGLSDVNKAVAAAKDAFENFSMTSKAKRLSLLSKLLDLYNGAYDEIADLMVLEMGTTKDFSHKAQAWVGRAHLENAISALENEVFEEIRGTTLISKEPIGVCALITPWNWPINQITLKVLPALATGCTCILKPSEYTPISAMIYAEILNEAGYPKGVFNLVHGEGPVVGTAMSQHPDIQMMSFTGSTRAGTAVTCDAAETVKRVTLELGGKSPNLVFADCDLEERVIASVDECMFNTGQSCDAPTRLLVERACYDDVLSIAKRAAEQTNVGNPAEEGDHIGPLFDKLQFERVQRMIKVGIDEGATLLAGGLGKPEGMDKGWFVKPTIFSDVSNDMRIAQEEIFGPVLVIIPFENESEAVAIANDTPYGLAAYLQTGDPDRKERVSAKLKAGAVHINGGGIEYGTPFGGYKQSGNGREGGLMGLEDYLETKTLHGL